MRNFNLVYNCFNITMKSVYLLGITFRFISCGYSLLKDILQTNSSYTDFVSDARVKNKFKIP